MPMNWRRENNHPRLFTFTRSKPMIHNHNRIINAYVISQGRDGVRRLAQVDANGTQRPERGIEHPVVQLVEANHD